MKAFIHKMQKLFLALSFLVISMQASFAHGAGCACNALRPTAIGGPIITIPAYTMPKGTFSIGYGLNYLNNHRLNQKQILKVIKADEHADDNYGSLNQSLSMAWGASDDLNFFVTMPFNIAYDFREVHDGIEDLGNSIGFGDMTILAQYRFLNLSKTNLALLGGIKLPTGKTHVKSNTGETFEALNNPGSGSFDPLFGFALSRPVGSFGLDFNFLYKLATQGSQDTDIGDVANYNFAISYAVNHDHNKEFDHKHKHQKQKKLLAKIFPQHLFGKHLSWDLILELNSNWEAKPEQNNIKDNNHGGTSVFLSPGIRLAVDDNFVYNFGLGFPIIEDLNGEQGGTDLQLYTGFAMSF